MVYAVTPAEDIAVDIDLCYSSYDTKLYIYDENLNLIACNDDAHFSPPCFTYSSKLENIPLQAGATYFIVIDGYGQAAGPYQLDITTFEPCVINVPADAQLEGEPVLVDGYLDAHNGGCNSPEFGNPFQQITEPEFAGKSGWYLSSTGTETRDTDWFEIEIPNGGVLEITGDAEYPTYMFELAPQDCGMVAVAQQVTIGPCLEATMTIVGAPGSTIWFWVGPSTFTGPVHEYQYVLHNNMPGGCFPEGVITIDPRPAAIEAPWELITPGGAVIQGSGYHTLETGEGLYTMTWHDVPGWITPDPATVLYDIGDFQSNHLFTATYLLDLPYATDFDDGSPPFFTVVSGTWMITAGWYRCHNATAGTRQISMTGHEQWTDYHLGVDVMSEGTPTREVLFRYQSPERYYRLQVQPHPVNMVELWKFADGLDRPLHVQSTGMIDGAQPQRVEIAAIGGTFQAYLDGEFLFEVDDPDEPLLAGGVALCAYAESSVGWQLASFDNLAIGPLNVVSVAPLPAVTNLSLAAVPNPFNPATVVSFELPHAGDVTIAVHDLRGRLVRTLLQGEVVAGQHEVTWDGRDGVGNAEASGIYLVRLVTADGRSQAVKVTLAK